jgi:hypothetical protein
MGRNHSRYFCTPDTFGTLAALIPGLRCAFLVMILLIILIPWFIYIGIRNYAGRTAGRLWWFL